jgi:MYXO-CTERM domain-containing protein
MKRICLAAIAALLLSAPARADVVMPPPTDCPRGQVGVTSHGGPRCEIEAPKDCPNGWDGALGGTCILRPCANDSECGEGKECVEHAVCLEPFQDEYYDYGEDEREEHGENEPRGLLRSPGLLAGPMAPKKKRPTPITRYNAMNLCAPDIACGAPRTCQPEKLCVPKGTRAVAYKGANISGARVARKTATPITTSAASPTEKTSPNVTRPPGRGCGGCASSAEGAPGAGLFGAAALALLGALRRRSRRS